MSCRIASVAFTQVSRRVQEAAACCRPHAHSFFDTGPMTSSRSFTWMHASSIMRCCSGSAAASAASGHCWKLSGKQTTSGATIRHTVSTTAHACASDATRETTARSASCKERCSHNQRCAASTHGHWTARRMVARRSSWLSGAWAQTAEFTITDETS
jgi:hypothetical protein